MNKERTDDRVPRTNRRNNQRTPESVLIYLDQDRIRWIGQNSSKNGLYSITEYVREGFDVHALV